jgi:hypothetical protein
LGDYSIDWIEFSKIKSRFDDAWKKIAGFVVESNEADEPAEKNGTSGIRVDNLTLSLCFRSPQRAQRGIAATKK